MKHFPPVLRTVLALLAGAAGGLHGADWQSLLGNSPFGPPAPAAAPGDLEFRGVVEEEGILLVNLYNPVTKTAQWLPVRGQAPGIDVQSYDAGSGRLSVTQSGRQLSLSLKQARIALVSTTASLQLVSEPGPETADLPEFMRNLPPEARQLLAEARRRRALRPPFPGTETEITPPAPAAPANR